MFALYNYNHNRYTRRISMSVLRVDGLTKKYGKGESEVIALNGISLSVNKGEFTAIVGPSGSGKSTMLHLLGGVDKPTGGKVYIDDVNIYSLSEKELAILRRRKVGFVFQFYNLIPVLTAEENIEMPMLLDGRKPDKKYVEELLELLALKDRRHHLPSELSGGQQQRVSIGRALINKPSIILADEPTGNLDSKTSKEIMELLKYSVKKYNQTLILITHDLSIASMADRIITLSDGKVVKDEVMK
jgi:putative ABC transport system ATP-binding protein